MSKSTALDRSWQVFKSTNDLTDAPEVMRVIRKAYFHGYNAGAIRCAHDAVQSAHAVPELLADCRAEVKNL